MDLIFSEKYQMAWGIGQIFFKGVIYVMIMKAVFCRFPVMTPREMTIFRHTGSSVSFGCTLDNSSSDLLSFQFCNGSGKIVCYDLHSKPVNVSTREVTMEDLKTSDTGSYICRFNQSNGYFDNRKLKVGYPPERLGVECSSSNYIDLTCTWRFTEKQMQNGVPTFWNITFKNLFTFGQEKQCPHFRQSESNINCYWPSADQEGVVFQPSVNYSIYVNGWNRLGRNKIEYFINPVSYVVLSPVTNPDGRALSSTSILLKWEIPEDAVLANSFLGNFICQICYSSDGTPTLMKEIETDKGEVSKVLSNFLPHRTYNFRVRCRAGYSVGDRYWSQERTTTVLTLAAVPAQPPGALEWSYYQVIDKALRDFRCIYLFTKPIPPGMMNSAGIFYSISIYDGDHLLTEFNTTSDVTIDITHVPLLTNREYAIQIRSGNEVGLSRNWSQINIPKAEEVSSLRKDAVIAEKMKAKVYLVSYDIEGLQDGIMYSVFVWCKGSRTLNICKEDLQWSIEAGNKTEYIVHTDVSESDWLFGVTLVYKENKSSGLHFADCVFSSEVAQIPDIMLTEDKEALQLGVVLLFEYCSLRSQPKSYVVLYDSGSHVDTTECNIDSRWNSISYKANISTNYLKISELNPDTLYYVCLAITTRTGGIVYTGIKQYHTSVIIRTDLNISKSLIYILAAAFGFLTLLFIVIVVMCLRQKIKNFSRQFEIEVPRMMDTHGSGEENHRVSEQNDDSSTFCNSNWWLDTENDAFNVSQVHKKNGSDLGSDEVLCKMASHSYKKASLITLDDFSRESETTCHFTISTDGVRKPELNESLSNQNDELFSNSDLDTITNEVYVRIPIPYQSGDDTNESDLINNMTKACGGTSDSSLCGTGSLAIDYTRTSTMNSQYVFQCDKNPINLEYKLSQ